MLHAFGTMLFALFYFTAGAMLGEAIHRCWYGQAAEVLKSQGRFWFTLLSNLVALPCLLALWKRRESEPIKASDRRLGFFSIYFHGLPVNRRILILLGVTLWPCGVAVALIFSIPR